MSFSFTEFQSYPHFQIIKVARIQIFLYKYSTSLSFFNRYAINCHYHEKRQFQSDASRTKLQKFANFDFWRY